MAEFFELVHHVRCIKPMYVVLVQLMTTDFDIHHVGVMKNM